MSSHRLEMPGLPHDEKLAGVVIKYGRRLVLMCIDLMMIELCTWLGFCFKTSVGNWISGLVFL